MIRVYIQEEETGCITKELIFDMNNTHEAIIAAVHQNAGDYNWWNYEEDLEDIKDSARRGTVFYEDGKGNVFYATKIAPHSEAWWDHQECLGCAL